MKSTLKIHSNPSAFKSLKVDFTKKELEALNQPRVKTAITKAERAWKSIKDDSSDFADRLKKVQAVMVNGNSPKSLFSKWLKSVGIPRSTAYWTLQHNGVKGNKQPSVKQLLTKRENLQLQLSKAAKEEKGVIRTKLDSVTNQLSRRREALENRLKFISAELKEVMVGISALGHCRFLHELYANNKS